MSSSDFMIASSIPFFLYKSKNKSTPLLTVFTGDFVKIFLSIFTSFFFSTKTSSLFAVSVISFSGLSVAKNPTKKYPITDRRITVRIDAAIIIIFFLLLVFLLSTFASILSSLTSISSISFFSITTFLRLLVSEEGFSISSLTSSVDFSTTTSFPDNLSISSCDY